MTAGCLLPLALLAAVSPQEPDAPDWVPPYPNQDVLAYAVGLHVDPAREWLEGEVRYRVRAVTDLASVDLDARQSLTWEIAFHDDVGQPLEILWAPAAPRVRVLLPEVVPAGEVVTFGASLSGRPPDGFYFAGSRYGTPMAFTDHYSIRASGWLPCEDHPEDRAEWSISVVHPDDTQVVATGLPQPVEETPADGWAQWHSVSRSDVPPYMMAIVVGSFDEVREEGDPRLWPHLVYPQDTEKARASLVHHAEWIRTMEETFGALAYGKYMVVQCPTRWGGFEAPGNVLVSERLFDGRQGGVGTLAHELVHMWFGDAVGYATWHEVWLSEGFASYFGPWLWARTGGPSLRDSLVEMRERWLRAREGPLKPVRWRGFEHPDQALNANTYPKGAWVLHMLRVELGDEVFFAALREYYERFRGQAVLTSDLVEVVDEVSEREMAWFFDQWLDRPDSPRLRVTVEEGAIVVEQVQQEEFVFPLRLRWVDGEGETVEEVVRVEERRIEVPVPGEVNELAVDPEVELLWREVE